MDHCELFTESGFPKGLPLVTSTDKIVTVQTVALHYVLRYSTAEIDQFAKGLQALGVLDAVKKSPTFMRRFFTKDEIQHLTSGKQLYVQMKFVYTDCV